MANAIARVKSLNTKTTSTTSAGKLAVASLSLKAPIGGFRQPSIKDQAIIKAISENPKSNSIDLSFLTGRPRTEVNSTILYTREARTLAESGKVALPTRGARPDWYHLLTNKEKVIVKKAKNRLPMLSIPKNSINNSTRVEWMATAKLIADAIFRASNSPKVMTNLLEEINRQLNTAAVREDTDGRQIKALTTVVTKNGLPMPVLSGPGPMGVPLMDQDTGKAWNSKELSRVREYLDSGIFSHEEIAIAINHEFGKNRTLNSIRYAAGRAWKESA